MKTNYIMEQVQSNLTKNVKATPNDVKKYFAKLPADSIPYVPMQVEVQIVQLNPMIPKQEIEDVKARLRDFTDRVNKGETPFSTLAIMYSQDDESAKRGGELGYMNRSELVPEFANVAFNLSDPKKVSRIVETEFGYHIIQLIEKRGDRINTRHILLRPKVSDKDLTDAINRLDSVRNDIVDSKKFSFEEAVAYLSQDKDTRNNRGVMVNQQTGTPQFEMSQLPQDVAKIVGQMKPGDISKPFVMIDPKLNREVVAMVKLSKRIAGHKATIVDDYQTIKNMYENAQRDKMLADWIEKKIAGTYVRIEPGWRNCEFIHSGWLKQ